MKNMNLAKKIVFATLSFAFIGAAFFTQAPNIEAADDCSKYEKQYADLQKEYDARSAELNAAQAELNMIYLQVGQAQQRANTPATTPAATSTATTTTR